MRLTLLPQQRPSAAAGVALFLFLLRALPCLLDYFLLIVRAPSKLLWLLWQLLEPRSSSRHVCKKSGSQKVNRSIALLEHRRRQADRGRTHGRAGTVRPLILVLLTNLVGCHSWSKTSVYGYRLICALTIPIQRCDGTALKRNLCPAYPYLYISWLLGAG